MTSEDAASSVACDALMGGLDRVLSQLAQERLAHQSAWERILRVAAESDSRKVPQLKYSQDVKGSSKFNLYYSSPD